MEFNFSEKIKKGETEKIAIPNLKDLSLLPKLLKFTTHELDFTLKSQNTTLLKYAEPFFRVFNEIDLTEFQNKIAEGEDLMMELKNLSKAEATISITIQYEKHLGNVIFANTYHESQIFDRCLEDVYNAGQITQLIIDSDNPIISVILDPIYKIDNSKITDDDLDVNFWSGALALQNNEPSTRMVIDFTDPDLEGYVKFLKFYKLQLVFAKHTAGEASTGKIHIVGFGYRVGLSVIRANIKA